MLYTDCKFGVEMEYSGISRQESATALSNYFGTSFYHAGDRYDRYDCFDGTGRKWSIMSDSSIRSVDRQGNRAGYPNQCELVTPVLTFDDMDLLMEVLRQIRHAGGKSNTSCGFHVHVSCRKAFNVKQLTNLINMVHAKQDLLYEALKVYEGRARYCQKIPENLCTAIKHSKPQSMEALADIWYKELDGEHSIRSVHYNGSRYHCLNLHNLLSGRLPTVEFRCANGGFTDARRVKAIIQFYCLMVAYSFSCNHCSFKPTVVDDGKSKKYAFRVFMLKIGAIGPALAHCRKYMLENLDGDIAWSDR